MTSPELQFDLQLVEMYKASLIANWTRPGVTGVDIGFRYVDGQRTSERTVRVHMAAEDLEPSDATPGPPFGMRAIRPRARDLDLGDGSVEIVRGRYAPHAAPAPNGAASPTDRLDPIQPGVSISHRNGSGGTLGLIVIDVTTGKRCVLSNSHVLFGHPLAEVDDPIVQPAAMHHGISPAADVATIVRGRRANGIDAAIAALLTTRNVSVAMFGTNETIAETAWPRLGDHLKKLGARTGESSGIVDGIGRYRVGEVADDPDGIEGFRVVSDPAVTIELSRRGDSGSVWFRVGTQTGVGLHVGGEASDDATDEYAIACHLTSVFDQLDLKIAND
jgi:endonuclease G, mitochondrial